MAKITHEKWKCIGCGACAAVCSAHWEMGDSKAHMKGGEYKKTDSGDLGSLELEDPGCCKAAADSCPVQCIHILGSEKPVEEKKE